MTTNTNAPAKRDPVVDMLNNAMNDSVSRAGLLNCGFLKKPKRGGPVEWATDPATIVVAIKLAKEYGLDLMQRHLLPLEGKVYTTRDAMLFSAQKSGQLDGMEQEDEAVLTNGIGQRVERDPMEDPKLAEALTVEAKAPSTAEWRVWAVVIRNGHRYRFAGRYPYWRKSFRFEGTYPNGRRVFNGWEPHPHGPEMAVKCAEVACLRRAFNIALPTMDERGALGVETFAPAGGSVSNAPSDDVTVELDADVRAPDADDVTDDQPAGDEPSEDTPPNDGIDDFERAMIDAVQE